MALENYTVLIKIIYHGDSLPFYFTRRIPARSDAEAIGRLMGKLQNFKIPLYKIIEGHREYIISVAIAYCAPTRLDGDYLSSIKRQIELEREYLLNQRKTELTYGEDD